MSNRYFAVIFSTVFAHVMICVSNQTLALDSLGSSSEELDSSYPSYFSDYTQNSASSRVNLNSLLDLKLVQLSGDQSQLDLSESEVFAYGGSLKKVRAKRRKALREKRRREKELLKQGPQEEIPPEDHTWMEVNVGLASNISSFTRVAFSGTYRTEGDPLSIEIGRITRLPITNPVFEDRLNTLDFLNLSGGYMGTGTWSMSMFKAGIGLIYVDNETCISASSCKLKGGLDLGLPVSASINWGKFMGAGLGLNMMIYKDGVVATVDLNFVLGDFN